MKYEIELKPKAIKDLDSLQKKEAQRIVERIKRMENNLDGDVKRLTNFTRNIVFASEIFVCFLKWLELRLLCIVCLIGETLTDETR